MKWIFNPELCWFNRWKHLELTASCWARLKVTIICGSDQWTRPLHATSRGRVHSTDSEAQRVVHFPWACWQRALSRTGTSEPARTTYWKSYRLFICLRDMFSSPPPPHWELPQSSLPHFLCNYPTFHCFLNLRQCVLKAIIWGWWLLHSEG